MAAPASQGRYPRRQRPRHQQRLDIAVGGKGGSGDTGGNVTVTQTGNITTEGMSSAAIFAQSVGGGGGDGGASRAFSFILGAKCPPATPKCDASNKVGDLSIGGNGGSAEDAGTVTVTNSGMLRTTQDDSDGIFAQSIGGGGGIGGNGHIGAIVSPPPGTVSRSNFGKTLTIGVGGSGGDSGDGKAVTVTNTNSIYTEGATSYGIFAQSVGAGGGIGGDGDIGATGKVGIGGGGGAAGNGGDVTVSQIGNITTNRQRRDGDLRAKRRRRRRRGRQHRCGSRERQEPGDRERYRPADQCRHRPDLRASGRQRRQWRRRVGHRERQRSDHGLRRRGIFAQSIGGGGGAAGNLGNTIGAGLNKILGWTGSVGGTGNGGDVTVNQTGGNIITLGNIPAKQATNTTPST